MACLCVASTSGGCKAGRPGCVGPLAPPAGPHPTEDQRGGAVVPAEGLHASWPRAPAQEWRRVHRGHPHPDRQRAWWVCACFWCIASTWRWSTLTCFLRFHSRLSSVFSSSKRINIFPSLACVGVMLLQLPVGPVMCLQSSGVWGRPVCSLSVFVQPCRFIHSEFSLILPFVSKGWETSLAQWVTHLPEPDNMIICVCVLLISPSRTNILIYNCQIVELVKWANILQKQISLTFSHLSVKHTATHEAAEWNTDAAAVSAACETLC